MTLIHKHGCPKCPLSAYCLVFGNAAGECQVSVADCAVCKRLKLVMYNHLDPSELHGTREVGFVWMVSELVCGIPINCKIERTEIRPVCPDCGGKTRVIWDHRVIRTRKRT
jgi:hypothetical protein